MASRAQPARRPLYARSSPRTQHAVGFIERYCRHTKGQWAGRGLKLEGWQRDEIIAPLFGEVTRKGIRRYTEALIGLPRKNGKSTLASAIALYLLIADGEPGAEIYSAAGDKDQARIVFGQARAMVRASPHLSAWCRVFKDVIEVPETESIYRVLSSDAPLKHGLNPHGVVIDELHVHKDPELYYALTTGSGARREPLSISITTAGFDEASLCFDRYQYGLKGKDPRFFFRWWGLGDKDSVENTRAVRRANPASWLTTAYLAERRQRLPVNVFTRLHANRWVRQVERWLPMDRWDLCDGEPTFPSFCDVVVAVDAAPKRDRTAVVLARRDDEEQIHARAEMFKADETGILDYAAVEDFIRELARTYNVTELAYDPYHFTRSARDLEEEGLFAVEFPQSDQRMVPASQSLYDAVVEGRLRHGGDPVLREHADAAAAKQTSRGWRLHKMKATRPIDAIIALAIAIDRLESGDGPVTVTVIAGPDT